MKPFKFNVAVLMLITSIASFAQTKLVYSKSFETDLNTTAIFNLENTAVAIEESEDNMMHFDYKIEFSNYTKKEIQSFLDNIKVEAVIYQNHITLTANSASKVVSESFEVDSPFGLTLDSDFFKTDSLNHKISKKSKDSIISLINDESFKAILKSFKLLDKDKNKKPLDLSKVKMYKSLFVIKLPKSLKLTISGKESQITFREDYKNELSLSLVKGFFKAKKLANAYNKIKIENANFKSEEINGGKYNFINVTNGLIGSVSQVDINSELSKIQIGEVQKNVTITDFNSEYWLYNWSVNFNRFDLFSQYSKIHYFYPETDYGLKVIGNNTVNYFGNTKVVMQPSKKGEKFNLMERKLKTDSPSGTINIDIVHGVIYSYDQAFFKSEN
ncbi:MAG: hypothetical protein R2785_02625 [Flavobacteriaceae bacterium]